MSLEVTKKNVAAVGLKAGPIFVAAARENGYLLFSRHGSDVDANIEITLHDVFGSDQVYLLTDPRAAWYI
jgi:hypothetical protein